MGILGNKDEQRTFDGLTDRQHVFVLKYVADLSPTRAARGAGYRHPNVAGAKLLKVPKVRKAIRALLKPKLEEVELTADNVLGQLSRFLFRNLNLFLDADGDLACSPRNLPEGIQQTIESWDVNREYHNDGTLKREKVRVRLVSKAAALELAMKYLLITENTNIAVNAFDWDHFYGSTQDASAEEGVSVEVTDVESNNGRPDDR